MLAATVNVGLATSCLGPGSWAVLLALDFPSANPEVQHPLEDSGGHPLCPSESVLTHTFSCLVSGFPASRHEAMLPLAPSPLPAVSTQTLP